MFFFCKAVGFFEFKNTWQKLGLYDWVKELYKHTQKCQDNTSKGPWPRFVYWIYTIEPIMIKMPWGKSSKG